MAKTQTRRRISQEEPTKRKQEEEEGGKATRKPTTSCHPINMKKGVNRGAWTAEEDTKLAQVIQIYGPRRWQSIAAKAGLNRCGKSCRLRWMNYLRPNIKRGNISDQEEDLILRLHNLLGNRWSLIAGRIPGRTDNEIKNYWNSHLSKKLNQGKEQTRRRKSARKPDPKTESRRRVFGKEAELSNENKNAEVDNTSSRDQEEISKQEGEETDMDFNVDDFFDFSNEKAENLEWVNRFLELDEKKS